MKNRILYMAVAAAMSSMQAVPQALKTTGHRIAAGGNPFNKRQSKNKHYRSSGASKYTSHQGEQECARRLREGSPAWHSRMEARKYFFEPGI